MKTFKQIVHVSGDTPRPNKCDPQEETGCRNRKHPLSLGQCASSPCGGDTTCTYHRFSGLRADKPRLRSHGFCGFFFHSSSRTCEKKVSLTFWSFAWQLEQLFLVMIRHGSWLTSIENVLFIKKSSSRKGERHA